MHEAADNLETVAPDAALPREFKCFHRTELGLSRGRRAGSITEKEEGKKAQAGQSKALQGVAAEGRDSDPCRQPFPQPCPLQGGFVLRSKMLSYFQSSRSWACKARGLSCCNLLPLCPYKWHGGVRSRHHACSPSGAFTGCLEPALLISAVQQTAEQRTHSTHGHSSAKRPPPRHKKHRQHLALSTTHAGSA